MNLKTRKNRFLVILILFAIGLTVWLGDYSAEIMSTSTTVKNSMLVQIIFLLGLITGTILRHRSQHWNMEQNHHDRAGLD